MADADYDDYDAGYGDAMPALGLTRSRLSRVIHLGGAAASVGLVVWLGVWGYGSAMRTANGVPVIHAPKTPMRIAPENPGGEVAEHQGLAVNDIAAIGTAAPPPDRLLLAPRPMELTDDDVAGLTGLAATAAATAPATPADPMAVLAAMPVSASAMARPADPVLPAAAPAPENADAVAAALAEALAPEGTDDLAAMDPLTQDAALSGPTSGPTDALRPRARPDAVAALDAALGVDAAAALPITELDPTTLTEGTRLAQLGAYDSPEQARAEWVKLTNLYADLLVGKSMVIQSAESGGRSFFRLRAAGFQNEIDSRDFCAAIVTREGTCIPVIHR